MSSKFWLLVASLFAVKKKEAEERDTKRYVKRRSSTSAGVSYPKTTTAASPDSCRNVESKLSAAVLRSDNSKSGDKNSNNESTRKISAPPKLNLSFGSELTSDSSSKPSMSDIASVAAKGTSNSLSKTSSLRGNDKLTSSAASSRDFKLGLELDTDVANILQNQAPKDDDLAALYNAIVDYTGCDPLQGLDKEAKISRVESEIKEIQTRGMIVEEEEEEETQNIKQSKNDRVCRSVNETSEKSPKIKRKPMATVADIGADDDNRSCSADIHVEDETSQVQALKFEEPSVKDSSPDLAADKPHVTAPIERAMDATTGEAGQRAQESDHPAEQNVSIVETEIDSQIQEAGSEQGDTAEKVEIIEKKEPEEATQEPIESEEKIAEEDKAEANEPSEPTEEVNAEAEREQTEVQEVVELTGSVPVEPAEVSDITQASPTKEPVEPSEQVKVESAEKDQAEANDITRARAGGEYVEEPVERLEVLKKFIEQSKQSEQSEESQQSEESLDQPEQSAEEPSEPVRPEVKSTKIETPPESADKELVETKVNIPEIDSAGSTNVGEVAEECTEPTETESSAEKGSVITAPEQEIGQTAEPSASGSQSEMVTEKTVDGQSHSGRVETPTTPDPSLQSPTEPSSSSPESSDDDFADITAEELLEVEAQIKEVEATLSSVDAKISTVRRSVCSSLEKKGALTKQESKSNVQDAKTVATPQKAQTQDTLNVSQKTKKMTKSTTARKKKSARDKLETHEEIHVYTSLANAQFHLNADTNRMTTILQTNRIDFELVDLGTNDRAKKLWKWRGKGKKLPGIVRGEEILGNLTDLEEANELGEVEDFLFDPYY